MDAVGELRAYALDLAELRAVLDGGPEQRDRAAALVRPVLAPPAAPSPLGPIFTRVPGAPLVRDDDPGPADLDRLLGGEPAPADRVRATWRLAEALVAARSRGAASTPSERPAGLRPPPLTLPAVRDCAAGTWDVDQADARPALRAVADAVRPDPGVALVVFWSAAAGRGPTG